MRLCFLDVDGALNSHDWWRRRPSDEDRPMNDLDPDACARLQRWCDEHDVDIVVSSTWRLLHKRTALCDMFRVKGLTRRVWGVTPALPETGKVRGDEIALWLSRTASMRLPEPVTGIVILDDDSDMAHLAPWHVKTHYDRGLTDWELGLATKVIAQPPPEFG